MSNEPTNPEFPNPNAGHDSGSNTGFGATATLPPPAPAAPVYQRRSRLAIFFGIVAAGLFALLIALVGLVMVGIAAVAAVASGDWDFDTDTTKVDITPTVLSDLPSNIVEDKGEIKIDLTEMDFSRSAAADGPVELDVRVDYGSIKVIVPEDLVVSVDASVDLGEVTVFDDSSDGFSNSVVNQSSGADTDLELELDLNVGKIEVVRG
ncbi:MAG: LiaF domain-containing protein [Acidimicrobiales bacterium]